MVFVTGTYEESEGDAGHTDDGGLECRSGENEEAGKAEAAGGEVDEVLQFVSMIEGRSDGGKIARGEPPEECEPAAEGDDPEGGLMPELTEH